MSDYQKTSVSSTESGGGQTQGSSVGQKASSAGQKGDDVTTFGRLRQRMGEMMGRKKTEYDEEFQTKLRLAEMTKGSIQDVVKGARTQISSTNPGRYSGLQKGLEKASIVATRASLQDADRPNLIVQAVNQTKGWAAAETAYKNMENREKEMMTKLTESLKLLELYVDKEYPQFVANREKLDRKRVEMDAARHKAEKTTSIDKLETVSKAYQMATKNFDDQADTVQKYL
ncbi:MAG: hypothetical protein GY696_09410, partial [Gammaproteobacteria bacterium]|nr:hypothetical protein [Gammaproteobacteria bacterium]